MILDVIITAMLTLIGVAWLRERILYVIFAWAYVQNFILAWAYTSGWLGKDVCQALLISKEFLLLWLFLYYAFSPSIRNRTPWPLPLRVLGFFTAWCVVRYAAAVVIQGESLFGNLWNLRMACFPLEILTIAVAVASAKPAFATRLIRNMVLLVGALALAGIALDVIPQMGFWRDHVNIASYNLDVKGEAAEGTQLQDLQAQAEGVTGNGIGRIAFSSFSPFRAFGTVGDAVSFGHFVAFPALLLAFWMRRNWKTEVMLATTIAALFLSFTRSAWIFVAVAFLYILLRKHRYRIAFGLAGVSAVALFGWVPLANLYSGTLADLSSSSSDAHAQGVFWFYTHGLWQLRNIIGQGMTADLVESGYGILLIRYGLPAVLCLIWFCFVLYRSLQQSDLREKPLSLIAQAVPLALLVTLNFSYYAFSFIPYLLVWFVVGTCLAASTGIPRGLANGRTSVASSTLKA